MKKDVKSWIFALWHMLQPTNEPFTAYLLEIVPYIKRRYRKLSRQFLGTLCFGPYFTFHMKTFHLPFNKFFLFCYRQMAVQLLIDVLKTVPPDELLKELPDIMKVLTIIREGKILFPSCQMCTDCYIRRCFCNKLLF